MTRAEAGPVNRVTWILYLTAIAAAGCQTLPSAPAAGEPSDAAPGADAPPARPVSNLQDAQQALTAGEVQQAIRLYHRVIAERPDHPQANRDLAASYLQYGDPASALPFAIKAAWLLPDDAGAHANLGAVHVALNRPGEAIGHFRRAGRLDGLTPPLAYSLAEALLADRQWAEAVELLNGLTRIAPSVRHYERLGFAYFHMKQPFDSVMAYGEALRIDPDHVVSLNGLGTALMQLNQTGPRTATPYRRRALAAWRRSLALQPDQPRVARLLRSYGR